MMEQTDNQVEQQKVIFLLGAGASVDADVPDTFSFVKEFTDYIKESHPDLHQTLLSILEIRRKYNVDKWHKDQVDVEELLDTFRRLADRDKDPLLYFYKSNEFSLDNKNDDFLALESRLQNFIRKRVIVENEDKLDYLKELFKFDKPLEIYSTNYDTCIEQLCYSNHRLYTDGFDLNWDEANFRGFHDVKHYKLHGSVIWYQNQNTKECIKIPVDAFREKEPLDLRLIYRERIKPLIIYPAQKAEYIEPLTDLQLMFKHRLFKGTKVVIAVGFSFRDDYIVHMLWDAARTNDDLKLILINPNAQEIFDDKLKYSDPNKKAESRLKERVLCLPYPFSPIIYQLKYNYLEMFERIFSYEKTNLDREIGGEQNVEWAFIFKYCIDIGFLSKAEQILVEKIKKGWGSVVFDPEQTRLHYAFKALLHSVICNDEFQDIWLERFNEIMSIFSAENLHMADYNIPTHFVFSDAVGYKSNFRYHVSDVSNNWLQPLLVELNKVTQLLTPKFERKLSAIALDLQKLTELCVCMKELGYGINPLEYKIAENDSSDIITAKNTLAVSEKAYFDLDANIRKSSIEKIEREKLKKIFDNQKLEFKIN